MSKNKNFYDYCKGQKTISADNYSYDVELEPMNISDKKHGEVCVMKALYSEPIVIKGQDVISVAESHILGVWKSGKKAKEVLKGLKTVGDIKPLLD